MATARVHVQLVDPGSHFEHKEGTLAHDQVVELPRDAQVARAIHGGLLQVVLAPEKPPKTT
jgi:hypothetical protein